VKPSGHTGHGGDNDLEKNQKQKDVKKMSKKERKKKEEVSTDDAIAKMHTEAHAKKTLRENDMGGLLRTKGFVWLSNYHDQIGVLSHAANVLKMDFPGRWKALDPKCWKGTKEEKAAMRKDWVEPWGDRRQDLVFIGIDLKHEAIQNILDQLVLTNEEMAMGIDGWKAVFGDVMWEIANEAESDDDSDDDSDGEVEDE